MEEIKLMTILGAIEGASIRKIDYKYTPKTYILYKNDKILKDIDESIALAVSFKGDIISVSKIYMKINNCIFAMETDNAEMQMNRIDMYLDKIIECFLHMHLYNAMDIYNTLKNEHVGVTGNDYSVKDYYSSTGEFFLSAGYVYINNGQMVINVSEYVKKDDKYFSFYNLLYYNNIHFTSNQELSEKCTNILKVFEEMGRDNCGAETR
ncbi:MAG TPA: hypothetical protein VK190_02550 [Pseudoneobacillus sp.]|nr:hypothetical protein [Pseudoneobacillus sp.]